MEIIEKEGKMGDSKKSIVLNCVDLFSGLGGFRYGSMKRLYNWNGIKLNWVAYSEIAPRAIQHYEEFFKDAKGTNIGDITKCDFSKLPEVDIVCGGFPCGPSGTKIKVWEGYKNIEQITNKDKVLTHTNKYKKVVKTMSRYSNHMNYIRGVGCYNLRLTDEHPILIYRKGNIDWIETKDLKVGDYLIYNINTKSENKLNLTKEECWLIGRYLADGYIGRNNLTGFAIGSHKSEEFKLYCDTYKHYISHKDRTCQDYMINDKRLYDLVSLCGQGAKNKYIPEVYSNLPIDYLKELLAGYISGDGHYRKDRDLLMFSTISENLILSLQSAFLKTEKKLITINIRKENRHKINNDCFNGQFSLKSSIGQFISGDRAFGLVKSIDRQIEDIEVFNFEVKDDNSYTCNNVIVHNCQAFSIAGKKKGFEDPRGQLFNDVIRLINTKKPMVVFLENVKGLVFHNKGESIKLIIKSIEDCGYSVKFKVLDSKNFGVPQTRKRVYIVCFRNDIDSTLFKFPNDDGSRFDGDCAIRHILESKVDEKYYYNQKQREYMLANKFGEEFANIHPIMNEISNITPSRFNVGRIYDTNGIIGTITTSGDIGIWQGKRKFTERELLRLQGYPDDYPIMASYRQMYKLVGNSVTTSVISAVCERIYAILDRHVENNYGFGLYRW